MNRKRQQLIKDIDALLFNCDEITLIAVRNVMSKLAKRTDGRLSKANRFLGGIV